MFSKDILLRVVKSLDYVGKHEHDFFVDSFDLVLCKFHAVLGKNVCHK